MTGIVIVAARRTPQGRFLGALSKRSAVDLAVAAGRAALSGIPADAIDQVILGNVLSAGSGMNIARQVALTLGLPQRTPAFTVNMMCASGMQAVILAAQAIRAGEADVVLCGGSESMSQAPHVLTRARTGYRLGDGQVVDTLLRDGLVDPQSGEHMGLTAERVATLHGVSRADQDAFAARSQAAYAEAAAAGRFAAELAPIDGLTVDEHPRADATSAQLASLKPAFAADGTVTAGNAAGINDGAAMLVVCSDVAASRYGWPILARARVWAAVGCDPAVMGLGPVHAVARLQERHGLDLASCDTVEINEAFAAQALACARLLDLKPERINRDGGAIALGHPIGASGARLIVHLAQRTAAGNSERSLAALCVGGGMGVAMLIESAAGSRSR
ncbi:MAG: acetyl-CoA C-acyltransferase [Planctomycetes bacterium]|nr:acetyl-CoA C-acyltransferase [Planctomycetota bacterium]